MKSTESNSTKNTQQTVVNPPPGEGKASEPTIIAEQHRKPSQGPTTIKNDKTSATPKSTK